MYQHFLKVIIFLFYRIEGLKFIVALIIYCFSAAMYCGVLLPIYMASITKEMLIAAITNSCLILVLTLVITVVMLRNTTPVRRKYIAQIKTLFLYILLPHDVLTELLLGDNMDEPDVAVCYVFVFALVALGLGLVWPVVRFIWICVYQIRRNGVYGLIGFLPDPMYRYQLDRRSDDRDQEDDRRQDDESGRTESAELEQNGNGDVQAAADGATNSN
jgi:hypothetical protein